MSDVTVGLPIRLTFRARVLGTLTDASTVTLTVRKPDGTDATPLLLSSGGVTRDSVGSYWSDYVPSAVGHYLAAWSTTGPATGEQTYPFDVGPTFPVQLVGLGDFKAYLDMTDAHIEDDAELARFLSSATAWIVEHTGYTGQPQVEVVYPRKGTISVGNAPIAGVTSIVDSLSATISSTAYAVNNVAGTIEFLSPSGSWGVPGYSLSITYTRPPIPDDVKHGLIDLAADLWRSQRGISSMSRFGAGGKSDELGGPSPRWRTMIQPHLRVAAGMA